MVSRRHTYRVWRYGIHAVYFYDEEARRVAVEAIRERLYGRVVYWRFRYPTIEDGCMYRPDTVLIEAYTV